MRRPRPRLASVLPLPLLLGVGLRPGTCGSILDYNETHIVFEKVAKLSLTSDRGYVKTVSVARNGVRLSEHVFGYQASLGRQEHWVEGDTLHAVFECDGPTDCIDDFNIELPLDVALELELAEGDLELGATIADVTAQADLGEVVGLELESKRVELIVGTGGVDLTFAEIPDLVDVDVTDGGAALELPAGDYRCELVADDGAATVDGLTCDDAATALLRVHVGRGDITIRGT